MEDQIERAVGEIRAFVNDRPAPDLRAPVMRQVEALKPPFRRRGLIRRLGALLWSPREVSIRPAFALAAAAAVVTVVVLSIPYLEEDPSDGALVIADGSAPRLFVQFRLEADAARVQLAGSFTNWEPRYELRQYTPGIWTITVPLTQGVHDYAFVVDGQQWVADPYAPQIGDGFGGTNSRLTLLSPDTPRL
jgi:hypothetical protein